MHWPDEFAEEDLVLFDKIAFSACAALDVFHVVGWYIYAKMIVAFCTVRTAAIEIRGKKQR